jgi:hypothetical protein
MNAILIASLWLATLAYAGSNSLLNRHDLDKAPLFQKTSELGNNDGLPKNGWVCGKNAKESIRVKCDEREAEDFLEPTGVLEIQMETPGGNYDFGLRHAVQRSECRKMLRAIRKVQKENLPFCILGSYSTRTIPDPRLVGVNSTFYQLKSPLGYVIDMDF